MSVLFPLVRTLVGTSMYGKLVITTAPVSSDRGGENALDDVLLLGGEERQWRIFIVVTLSTPPLNKLRVSFYIYIYIYHCTHKIILRYSINF